MVACPGYFDFVQVQKYDKKNINKWNSRAVIVSLVSMWCRLTVPWAHVTIACHVTVLTSLELVTSCLLGLWIDFRILKFLKLKSQKFANIKDTLLNVHLSLFLHYEHVHIIGFMASCQLIMFMSILALFTSRKRCKDHLQKLWPPLPQWNHQLE